MVVLNSYSKEDYSSNLRSRCSSPLHSARVLLVDWAQERSNLVSKYSPPGWRCGDCTKYCIDIATSLLAITVLAPLMLLIALAVYLDSGSPILFRQRRCGAGMLPFEILKFRTMTELSGTTLRSGAQKVTRIGKFLRLSHLDELPQIINILKGDMSLVGPRPLTYADMRDLPFGAVHRCLARPGLTGWAQIHGGKQLSPEEKISMDIWYVEHQSLGFDLSILTRTGFAVMRGNPKNDKVIQFTKKGVVG